MESECEGCKMYSSYLAKCTMYIIPYISETLQCPCRTCIVKVVCYNMCEEFDDYGKLSDIKKRETSYENCKNKK